MLQALLWTAGNMVDHVTSLQGYVTAIRIHQQQPKHSQSSPAAMQYKPEREINSHTIKTLVEYTILIS